MKKSSFWRRLVSCLLVATLVFSLAACKKEEGNNQQEGSSGSAGNMANAELAKQNVYSYEPLALNVGDDFSIRGVNTKDNRLSMLVNIYDYTAELPEDRNKICLIAMNSDGSDISETYMELTKPESEEIDALRSKAEEKRAQEEGNLTQEEGQSLTNRYNYYGEGFYFYEDSFLANCALTEDGLVYGYRRYNVNFEDYDNPEENGYYEQKYLDCWDAQGKLLWETTVGWLENDENYSYLDNMIAMPDGTVALLLRGSKTELRILDKEGNISEAKEIADSNSIFEKWDSILCRRDGTILLSHYMGEDWSKKYISTFDINTGSFSEPVELPQTMLYNMYNMYEGADTDLVYAGSDGVYSYSVGDAEPVKFLDYVNSDLGDSLNNIVMVDGTHFIASFYDNTDGTGRSKIGIFTKVNPEDIKDKAVLVAGGNYIDYTLKNRVIQYNKASQDYRIVLKDYSQYNTQDDYMAGMNQLNNDIISGNMPDILCVDEYNMPLASYINKGLLVNIDEMIEKDPELSKAEFMENVFEAYRYNGKLYQIFPCFNIQTLIGKTSLLGDRQGWNMEEFLQVAKTLPEGCSAFSSDYTKSNFLYTMMNACGTDFVDLSTGKCSFDSQEFISILEFANTLKDDNAANDVVYDDEYWENQWRDSQSQYRENRTLLMICYINDFMSMKTNVNGYFGEDVNYVGYPSSDKSGAIIMINSSYAISAKSANIEGAWDFLRYYLTEEAAKKVGQDFWGLPVRKDVLREKLSDATHKSYWIDENGVKQEYDDYFDLNGESFVLDPLTQAQADQLFDAICNAKKRSYYSEAVNNIVNEEAQAFFSGQKTAQDVASVIQSRVQIYVNENQ